MNDTAPPTRRTAAIPRGLVLGIGAAALATVAVLVFVRRDPPTPVAPPKGGVQLKPADVIVELDGVKITWGDVADQVEWLGDLAPEYSLQKRIQKVLPEYTIPVVFARREFAAQREELQRLAVTLRKGTDNVYEFEKLVQDRTYLRGPMSRGTVTVPVARFLFDETNVGGVSQPIEVPMGFVIAATFGLEQARAPMEDIADAGLLCFFTHDDRGWAEWNDRLRERVRTRVTYVHPDLRLAMPPWLVLP